MSVLGAVDVDDDVEDLEDLGVVLDGDVRIGRMMVSVELRMSPLTHRFN